MTRQHCRIHGIGVGWLLGSILALSGCATLSPPVGLPPGDEPLEWWAAVLQTWVDAHGRVNFEGLARDRALLDGFVGWLSTHGPDSEPSQYAERERVLAYHLNAYNALAMFKVLEANVPPTLFGWRKVQFFVFNRVVVDGSARSLYHYENEVIRPLGEPRLHFALNCMVVGCPRLPQTPFTADRLNLELDDVAREFFNDPRHVRVDTVARIAHVSAILDFYTDDFLDAAPTLIAYINRYREQQIPATYQIAFIDYDWTINRQP